MGRFCFGTVRRRRPERPGALWEPDSVYLWFLSLLQLIVYAAPACIACFLATVGIWSSTPPTPPSASAVSSSSEPFFQGIKLVRTDRAAVHLLLGNSLCVSSFRCSTSASRCFRQQETGSVEENRAPERVESTGVRRHWCLLCFLLKRPPPPPPGRFVSQFLSSASSAATEEQSLPGAAAERRHRRGDIQRFPNAAGAGPVCAGLHQRKNFYQQHNTQTSTVKVEHKCQHLPPRGVKRTFPGRYCRLGTCHLCAGLCWTLRGLIHLVWVSGRCCSEFLRGQDQEVHRGHQGQHGLDRSGPHRLLPGENMVPRDMRRDFSVLAESKPASLEEASPV